MRSLSSDDRAVHLTTRDAEAIETKTSVEHQVVQFNVMQHGTVSIVA